MHSPGWFEKNSCSLSICMEQTRSSAANEASPGARGSA